ncbi:APH(3') family aminoglycoside O-phosphotransferase [Acetatifactor muris]|jgi:aminoglycoside phosphotransferase|uniref:APH(3') family aminoglycoside O-phosphotransferase n=1 Tax=Acetatifactor muris TaxID=879566 RepID=UPI0023EFF841|nr:APH(3') family aminoglycoside O-phosphotransferase [Acetatifactor muris]
MTEMPGKIREITGSRPFRTDETGMSDSEVILFEDMVLKVQDADRMGEAANEYRMMQWLRGRLPVPEVLAWEERDGKAWLLMTKLPGKMLCDEMYMKNPELLSGILAESLKMLWRVDVSDCPCANDLDRKLQMARYNVENGLVDMDNVEPETFGENGFRSPEHLLNWLEENRPAEEIVLSHGDFCLPNIFAEKGKPGGFIDLGKAGTADKWLDIALAFRSMSHNYSGKYGGRAYEGFRAEQLFEQLGLEPDYEKMKYYILLDELF